MGAVAAAARRRRPRVTRAVVLAGALVALWVAPAAASDADRYLEGFAAAVLDRDLGIAVAELGVEDGRARVVLADDDPALVEPVTQALLGIDGIEDVDVVLPGAAGEEAADEESGVELLPAAELFDPLLADPREPHFSAAYLHHLDDGDLGAVGSANFGESFALLGGEAGDGRWEIGILGGVFSIFDMEASSFDLVNSDFWVAPTFSLRRGGLSGQLRLYHRSSHIGDEFLLGGRGTRIDFGNEGLDLITSAELHPSLRVYLGGGVILHADPPLDRLSVQAGIELRSPMTFFEGALIPVAAFDYQSREELHWQEELSVVWGFELANPEELNGLRLAILGSYFTGNSPAGQFFGRRVEYVGAGVHLYF